jgi:hypothetical protein
MGISGSGSGRSRPRPRRGCASLRAKPRDQRSAQEHLSHHTNAKRGARARACASFSICSPSRSRRRDVPAPSSLCPVPGPLVPEGSPAPRARAKTARSLSRKAAMLRLRAVPGRSPMSRSRRARPMRGHRHTTRPRHHRRREAPRWTSRYTVARPAPEAGTRRKPRGPGSPKSARAPAPRPVTTQGDRRSRPALRRARRARGARADSRARPKRSLGVAPFAWPRSSCATATEGASPPRGRAPVRPGGAHEEPAMTKTRPSSTFQG